MRRRAFSFVSAPCLIVLVLVVVALAPQFGGVASANSSPLVEASLEGPIYTPTSAYPCGGNYVVAKRVNGKAFASGDNLEVLVMNPNQDILRMGFSVASRSETEIRVYISVCDFDARYVGPEATYLARITFVTGDGKSGQELLLPFQLVPRPATEQARAVVQSACRLQTALFSVKIDRPSLIANKSGWVTLRGVLYRGGVASPGDALVIWSGTSQRGRKIAESTTDASGKFEFRLRPTSADLYFTIDVPSRTSDIDGYLPVNGFPEGVMTLFPDTRSGGKNLKFDEIEGGGVPLPQVSADCMNAMSAFRLLTSNQQPDEPFVSPKAAPIGTFKLVTPNGTISVKKCWVNSYRKKDGTQVRGHPRRCP
jgi:hypothetical protein